MGTFAELKTEVADITTRPELTSATAQAVLDAIELYATERFFFNETRDFTFLTVAGTNGYTITPSAGIDDFIDVDWVKITVGGIESKLTRRTPNRFEDLASAAASGVPTDFAYFGQKFYLWPTPDSVYTIRVAGHYLLTALAADGETNVWTTKARRLVRAVALKLLYIHHIKDLQAAGTAQQDETLELEKLRKQTRLKRGAVPLSVDEGLLATSASYNINTD